MGKKVIYEVHAFLPEKDEPTSFFFDSYEAADLWLSDFDDGGISEMVIEDGPEDEYEETLRAMEEIERLEREARDSEDAQ